MLWLKECKGILKILYLDSNDNKLTTEKIIKSDSNIILTDNKNTQ